MEPSYKIIGGDGREYSAASSQELRSWILEGRVAGGTLVWRSDRESWLPAARHDEFRDLLRPSVAERQTSPGYAESDFVPVGFVPRLGAYIVDVVILNIVLTLLTWPWRAQLDAIANSWQQNPMSLAPEEMTKVLLAALLVTGAYSLLSAGYFVLMHGLKGATVGKMIVGARVTNLDGSPIDVSKATVRYMGELASWAVFGIGYLMIAFRSDRRGMHDLMAGTRVIYKRH